MKITKIILIVVSIALILSAVIVLSIDRSKPSASANNEQIVPPSDIYEINKKTGFEQLTEEEKVRISKLSVPELVKLYKTGETLQIYSAADQLKRGDGRKENFDLLLNLAEGPHGQIMTEGLVRPVKNSAPDEEKRMVDRYLDFLESQLKKEKPSVPYEWAVRGIGQAINVSNESGWKTLSMWPKINDLNDIDIPYANERATNILISCMDSDNKKIREAAIHWFGNIGANDPDKIGDMIKLLNDQLAKEQGKNETEQYEWAKTIIKRSLERLNQKAEEIENIKLGKISNFTYQKEPNN